MKTSNVLVLFLVFAQLLVAASPARAASTFSPAGIDLAICGESRTFEGLVEESTREALLPLTSPALKDALAAFGAGVAWNPSQKRAIFTTQRGTLSLETDKTALRIGKEEAALPVPLTIYQGEPYLPLKALALIVDGKLTYDDAMRTWYLDPWVRRLEVKEESKRFILVVGATGKIGFKTFMLREPDRFVIDVENAHLDLSCGALGSKEIQHGSIGKIRFDQFSLHPNVTRVVIPLGEQFEVENIPSKATGKLLFWVKVPQISAPGENFPRQKITGVDVECYPSGVRVKIEATGPIQYQWHRLKPPDNRYFIDITNAVLVGPARKLPFDDSHVTEVRLAQFQVEPIPVVRVVVELKVPAKCTPFSSASYVNTLLVDVEHSEVDMEQEPLQGFGATAFPKKGRIVCIDPGHGGWDPGAVNSALGLYEKTATLDICLRLARKLKKAGWNVVLTRKKDTDVSIFYPDAGSELGARVAVANGMKAQVFVSVHCNSATNTAAMGTSLHWCKEEDLVLAKTLHAPLVLAAGRPDRGLKQNRFYVLRKSVMPAVLIETAFLSNGAEGKLLGTPEFREKVAEGLYRGLVKYGLVHMDNKKKLKK